VPAGTKNVVEVLRRLRVDRERRQLAQVDAPLQRRLGQGVRLVRAALAARQEQAREHVLDPVGRAEQLIDPGPAAAGADDGEVARPGLAEPLAVDDDRHARLEERLADDEFAARRDLDDDTARVARALAPALARRAPAHACGSIVTESARLRFPRVTGFALP